MIVILFLLSESFDFEKKNKKRKLISSEKTMSFSIISEKSVLCVKISLFFCTELTAFLRALLSDSLRSLSSILLKTDLLLFTLLIFSLTNMLMCLRCFKILRTDAFICCVHAHKFIKCSRCMIEKIICHIMSLFSRHELFIADNNRFL